MKIINRRTINADSRTGAARVTVKTDGLYFNKAAIEAFNLKIGRYVQFMNDGKLWDLYQCDDKDGWPICKDGDKSGVQVCSRALVRLITKSAGVDVGCSFRLLDTTRRIKEQPILSIVFGK